MRTRKSKRGPGRPKKTPTITEQAVEKKPSLFEIIHEPINSWRGGDRNPEVDQLVIAMMKLPIDQKTAIHIGTASRKDKKSALAFYTTAYRRIQNDKAGKNVKFTYRTSVDMSGKYTGFKIYRIA